MALRGSFKLKRFREMLHCVSAPTCRVSCNIIKPGNKIFNHVPPSANPLRPRPRRQISPFHASRPPPLLFGAVLPNTRSSHYHPTHHWRRL